MIAIVQKMLAPIQRRVALMVSRAVITLVNDSLKMQNVQVNLMADVTRDGVERFQNYGHTSNPHPGAEGIMVSIGGNQDHGIVIVVDDRRYRLTGLAEGEVAMYDDLGQKVHLTRSGMIVNGGGLPVNVQNVSDLNVTTSGVVTVKAGGLAVAKGVIQGDCLCAFTGMLHSHISGSVKASA